MTDQIELRLVPMTDRNNKTFYGAFPDIPATLRLDEITFFIFVSDEGEETLVIRKRDRREERREDKVR